MAEEQSNIKWWDCSLLSLS